MVIGDEQLSRALPSNNLQFTFNQIGRDIPITFADAAGVADLIIQSGMKYNSCLQ